MTWLTPHQRSEELATEATLARARGESSRAEILFGEAAQAEQDALLLVEQSTPRTLGIVAVSAASLWFKSRQFQRAEQSVLVAMARPGLPEFAKADLRTILQAVWMEESKQSASVGFLPGQVLVSVKGGEVVYGGAPLDLILDKVQVVQSLFYRHIEMLLGAPVRKRGPPSRHIQDACRPWLFQAPAGSYQFSVAVQQPSQADFFRPEVDPGEVVVQFMDVLAASVDGRNDRLVEIVPDEGYRNVFVRLTRNLAPTSGGVYSSLEIRTAGDTSGIVVAESSRAELQKLLPRNTRPRSSGTSEAVTIVGVLRAVHLDDDWIEVVTDNGAVRIQAVQDAMDDVIGPMVNRRVKAQTLRTASRHDLLDIELNE